MIISPGMRLKDHKIKNKFLLAMAVMISFFSACGHPARSDLYSLGIVQITENPLLDEARIALVSTLQDSGLVDGQNIKIIYRNAQGEIPNISLILQSFRTAHVDMIVTVGTPCLVAAAQTIHDIPIVFTVAFSPEQVGLVLSDSNVSGVYDPLDMEYFVGMIKSVLPNCRRLGLPFNPAEANSRYAADRLISECQKSGLKIETVAVASSNDVLLAAQALSQRHIDAFIVAADNTIALAMDALVKVSSAHKIPIFLTEPGEVRKGALSGVGVSYNNWGRESGALAATIINGHSPRKPRIRPATCKSIIINQKTAWQFNLALPPELLRQAEEIIQ